MAKTKRPHYVPQTYFRPWTGEDGLLAYRRRGSDSAIPNSTRNIAVACGIYGSGELSEAREKAFGELESDWPKLRDELIAQGDLHGHRRQLFAIVAAVQLPRTLRHSDKTNFIVDVVNTITERPITQDAVRQYLEKLDGAEPEDDEVDAFWTMVTYAPGPMPTSDEVMSMAMDIAINQVAPRLESKRWTVRNFRRPELMTNDCPVHAWSPPAKRPEKGGVGIATADEVRFPLTPNALLVMTNPDAAPSNASIRSLNTEICRQSHQFVVATPACTPSLDGMTMAGRPSRLRFRTITRTVDGEEHEIVHMWDG